MSMIVPSAVADDARPDLSDELAALRAGFEAFDEPAMRLVLDRAIVDHEVADVVERLCFPFLRQLGDDWESGKIRVFQEHFASEIVRSRLASLAPWTATGSGERGLAVLACTPHERHDIGLLGFGLALQADGWAITFLGADTPVLDAVELAREREADLLVLCGTERHMFAAQIEQHLTVLRGLAPAVRLALGGPAARADLSTRVDAICLADETEKAVVQLRDLLGDPAGDLAGDLTP